jgi:signal transduction histidine kinase
MPRSPHRRTLVLFSVLAVYVLSQFLWWAYLLVEKDNELQALLGQLEALGVRSTIDHDRPERTLWMVAGEGSVFVTLLLLALWLTYRTVRHELGLARLQRNFLMAASHELRTPIAALKLGLQTMHRRELEAAQQHMLMSNAIGDVARLEGLSEKILLATRLEEVKLPVQWGSVDLAALLRSLAQQARMSYGKDHTISMEAPPALLVQSDEEGLRSIFGNLLENACKYAPQGSEVSLVLRHLNGGLFRSPTVSGSSNASTAAGTRRPDRPRAPGWAFTSFVGLPRSLAPRSPIGRADPRALSSRSLSPNDESSA